MAKECKICGQTYIVTRKEAVGLCPTCTFWSLVDKTSSPNGCWLWTGQLERDGYGRFGFTMPNGKHEQRAHRISWEIANGTTPGNLSVLHCCDEHYPTGDRTNRRCVNPDHLRLGTPADNSKDMVSHGRAPRGNNHWSRVSPDKVARGDLSGSRLHPERLARGDANGSRLHPERLAHGDRNGSRLHPESRPRGDNHWSRLLPDRVANGDSNGSRLHPERLPRGTDNWNSKLDDDKVRLIRASTEPSRVLARRFGVDKASILNIRSGKTWRHVV